MPPQTRIIPALVHIQAHLDQDLSLDTLAGHVGLSKDHFHDLFQSATGETPKEYVERLRLEWAALQLRIRRVAVVEVALECGYRNHETFSRAFRRRFLTSPSEYRKQWFRQEHYTPCAGSGAERRALDHTRRPAGAIDGCLSPSSRTV